MPFEQRSEMRDYDREERGGRECGVTRPSSHCARKLAVPFFILAGQLMHVGGSTRRLVALAQALVGQLRASLGMISIVAAMFFAGISGSAVADTSAVGG